MCFTLMQDSIFFYCVYTYNIFVFVQVELVKSFLWVFCLNMASLEQVFNKEFPLSSTVLSSITAHFHMHEECSFL
jgi:hypothetical protein